MPQPHGPLWCGHLLFLYSNHWHLTSVSLASSHMALTLPQTQQAHSCHRIFALAILFTRNLQPQIFTKLPLLLPSSRNSNVTFPVRFHYLSYLKYFVQAYLSFAFQVLCLFLVLILAFWLLLMCCYHALECKIYRDSVLTINNWFSQVGTNQIQHAPPHGYL